MNKFDKSRVTKTAMSSEGLPEDNLKKGSKTIGKGKIKLTPIHIVVIVVLIIFVLLPSDEKPEEVVEVPIPTSSEPTTEIPPKKEANPPAQIENEAVAVEDTLNDTVNPTNIETETVTDSGSDTDIEPLDEEVAIDNNDTNLGNDDISSDIQVSEPESSEDSSAESTPSVPSKKEEESITTVDETVAEIEDLEELNLETDVDSIGEETPLDENLGQESATDSIGQNLIKEDISTQVEMGNDLSAQLTDEVLSKMEDDISNESGEENLELVPKQPEAAPTYEIVGRALVYNCSDLHWACIPVKNYQQCQRNYSWNNVKKLPVECYPQGVYSDIQNCALIQQNKTDKAVETNFCKN